MPLSRLDFETLVPGTDEVIVYALIPTKDLMAAGIKPLGTLLKDHPLIDPQGCAAYNDYMLTAYEEVGVANEQGEKMTRANFGKDYSLTVGDAVLTVYKKRPYSWPPVLSSLILRGSNSPGDQDYECVGGSSSGFNWDQATQFPAIDVKWSKDAVTVITKFKHEYFLSSEPHDLNTTTTGLYPRSIQFDRRVASASIPPCLHPTVTIPPIQVDNSSTGDFSEYAAVVFSATTNTGWATHPAEDTQEQKGGIWIREKVTALVPNI